MPKRFIFALLLSVVPATLWATEVSSIVACKADGETWLCAAYENQALQVFRSAHYISKVEFQGDFTRAQESPVVPSRVMAKPLPAVPTEVSPAASVMAASALPSGKYTLQLLACNSGACRRQMAALEHVEGSRRVEIRNQGKLWEVLIVGGYPSSKAAQQAAAELIKRYGLKNKPWVRTLESIRSRRVDG